MTKKKYTESYERNIKDKLDNIIQEIRGTTGATTVEENRVALDKYRNILIAIIAGALKYKAEKNKKVLSDLHTIDWVPFYPSDNYNSPKNEILKQERLDKMIELARRQLDKESSATLSECVEVAQELQKESEELIQRLRQTEIIAEKTNADRVVNEWKTAQLQAFTSKIENYIAEHEQEIRAAFAEISSDSSTDSGSLTLAEMVKELENKAPTNRLIAEIISLKNQKNSVYPIAELATTENTYRQNLQLLRNFLLNQPPQIAERKEIQSYIRDLDEAMQLFKNPTLSYVHFYESQGEAYATPEEVLKKFESFFNSDAFNQFKETLKKLIMWDTKLNIQFPKLTKTVVVKAMLTQGQELPVNSITTQSMQRVTRYPLTLGQVEKFAGPQECAAKVKADAKEVNADINQYFLREIAIPQDLAVLSQKEGQQQQEFLKLILELGKNSSGIIQSDQNIDKVLESKQLLFSDYLRVMFSSGKTGYQISGEALSAVSTPTVNHDELQTLLNKPNPDANDLLQMVLLSTKPIPNEQTPDSITPREKVALYVRLAELAFAEKFGKTGKYKVAFTLARCAQAIAEQHSECQEMVYEYFSENSTLGKKIIKKSTDHEASELREQRRNSQEFQNREVVELAQARELLASYS